MKAMESDVSTTVTVPLSSDTHLDVVGIQTREKAKRGGKKRALPLICAELIELGLKAKYGHQIGHQKAT